MICQEANVPKNNKQAIMRWDVILMYYPDFHSQTLTFTPLLLVLGLAYRMELSSKESAEQLCIILFS